MLFNSVKFLFIFFPLTISIYYLLPKKFKNLFMLLASLAFYSSAKSSHLSILIVSILITFFCGLTIASCQGKQARRISLTAGITANLLILLYFKYFNFIIESLDFFSLSFSFGHVALPIGLSFYIFQSISYLADIYSGKIKANRNIINVALYIAMFPQLVAGPIIRYSDISAQIADRKATLDSFSEGVARFIFGLAKKVLIADILAKTADDIFMTSSLGIDSPTAWLGAVCYALQIYFDFSGYSDMAIGLGRMFGFKYNENFNYPYISKSITEFWRRWHMSLSSWFRDYLYIPLGGNRRGNVYLNLFIVFCATGFWHGAAWTFLFWGLWHGLFLIVEKILKKKQGRNTIPNALGWIITMLIVVLGWVLFRAENIQSALVYFHQMFFSCAEPPYDLAYFVDRRLSAALLAGLIFSTPLWPVVEKRLSPYLAWNIFKIGLLMFLFILAIIFTVSGGYSPFIYFQF